MARIQSQYSETLKAIGQRIASKRKEEGLTQQELATKLGIVQQSISAWEQGRSVPDAINMIELCKTLNISADALLGLPILLEEGVFFFEGTAKLKGALKRG